MGRQLPSTMPVHADPEHLVQQLSLPPRWASDQGLGCPLPSLKPPEQPTELLTHSARRRRKWLSFQSLESRPRDWERSLEREDLQGWPARWAARRPGYVPWSPCPRILLAREVRVKTKGPPDYAWDQGSKPGKEAGEPPTGQGGPWFSQHPHATDTRLRRFQKTSVLKKKKHLCNEREKSHCCFTP